MPCPSKLMSGGSFRAQYQRLGASERTLP
jgi:hypothetical protein